MSSVDERVVDMKFNNAQFEKNVSTTVASLDRLNKSLNFKGGGKGLTELQATVGKFDMSAMSNAVDKVNQKFTTMGIAGVTAITNISNRLVDAIVSQVQQLSGSAPIAAGWQDYLSKLTSVQTIMNASGKSIGQVSKEFSQLDTYADQTIYNLQDMTGSWAKFTNAGIDTKKSIPAIKGIANMVALAGQDAGAAQIAMYNLSQSIAGGFLTTTDYKSLNLANVATKEWKDQMVQAAVKAGTLKKAGKGLYKVPGGKEAIKTQALFNEELSSGWATTDVLMKVLSDYGDTTTEIGKKAQDAAQKVKSLPMMMDTLAAAAGTGWTSTFEILLGNVEESIELFTDLTSTIGGFLDAQAKSRNETLQAWKDLNGRTELIQSFKNIFSAIGSVVSTIGDAFHTVFPPKTTAQLGQQLERITAAFLKFTEGLKPNADQLKVLKTVATTVFSVFKFGVDVIKLAWQGVSYLLGVLDGVRGVFKSIAPPTSGFVDLLDKFNQALASGAAIQFLTDRLTNFREFAIDPVIKALSDLKTSFEVLTGKQSADGIDEQNEGLKRMATIIEAIKSWAVIVGQYIGAAWVNVKNFGRDAVKAIKDFVSGAGEGFSNVGKSLSGAMAAISGFLSEFGPKLLEFIKGIDPFAILSAINTGILFILVKQVKDFIDGFGEAFDPLKETVEAVTSTLQAMQTNLKADSLMKIAIGIGVLAAALYVLAQVNPDRLGSAAVGMGVAFAAMFGALKIFEKINQMDPKSSVKDMIVLSVALLVLSAAIRNMAIAFSIIGEMDTEGVIAASSAMALIFGVLMGSLGIMSKVLKTTDPKEILIVAASMVVLAQAVIMMSGAMALLGLLPTDALVKGGIALTALMALMSGFVLISQKGGTDTLAAAAGMVLLAQAVLMLTGAVVLLGLTPVEVLAQGFATLAIMITGLVIAVNKMKDAAPGAVAMMAIAAALNLLIIPVLAFGHMDWQTLLVGIGVLAVLVAGMVLAAKGFQSALPGAAAMIALAAALTIMAVAIRILGGMSLGQVGVALLALGGALAIFAVGALVLELAIPVMLALAGVLALVGLAVIAFGAGIALFAGFAMLAAAGIKVLGMAVASLFDVAGKIAVVGAAFVALGVGLIAVGAGVVVLGAGLVLMGAGLALVATFGLIGATALIAVVKAIADMVWQAPQLLAMAGTFAALGAALVVMGAGLALVAAGAILFAVGLLALAGAAAVANVVLGAFSNVMTSLAPQADSIRNLGEAMQSLSSGFAALASVSATASANIQQLLITLQQLSTVFATVSTSVSILPMYMSMAVSQVSQQANLLVMVLKLTAVNVQVAIIAIGQQFTTLPKVMQPSFVQVVTLLTMFNMYVWTRLTILRTTINSSLISTASSVGNNAEKVGNAILDGMVRGMENSDKVKNAARSVANAALDAAKAALDIHSPSKEFEKLGKYANEGFAKGLTGSRDDIDAAFKTMQDDIKSAISSAQKTIKSEQKKLKKLQKSPKKNKKAIKETKADIAQAKKEEKAAKKAQTEVTKSMNDEKAALKALAKQYEDADLANKIKEATDAYNDAVKARDDYAASIKDQYSAIPGFTDSDAYNEALSEVTDKYDELTDKVNDAESALNDAKQTMADSAKSIKDQYAKLPGFDEDTTYQNYIDSLNDQLAATAKFRQDLLALRSIGLDDETYKAILDQGVAAQSFVSQLLEAGPDGLQQIKDLYAQLGDEAEYLGDTVSQEFYQAGVDSAQAVVDGLESQQSDAEKAVKDAAGNYVGGFAQELQNQIDENKKIAQQLDALSKLGLSDRAYEELVSKGADAEPFITDLLAKGKAGVDQVNSLIGQLDSTATALGNEAAKQLYQAGVDSAKGLLDGLKSQEKAIQDQMNKIASGMVATIKKELGIKSPSREFMKVGGYSVQGLADGLQKMIPELEKQSKDVGDSALTALQKSMNNVGDVLTSDMDMEPSIRPVLDLSQIKKDAATLRSMVAPEPIDVGVAFSKAASIAVDTRTRQQAMAEEAEAAKQPSGDSITYNQYNNSPKALSNGEIYRQTRNQLSKVKGGLPK